MSSDDRFPNPPAWPGTAPAGAPVSLRDHRLTRIFLRSNYKVASVSEYAQAAGMDTAEVVDILGDYLDDGTLALEFCGDEAFVHTAPQGRPAPYGSVEVPENLWERLRSRAPVDLAFALWRLIRSMERAGWKVETSMQRILYGLGPLAEPPYLGIDVGRVVIPVLIFPTAAALSSSTGLLADYQRCGASAVAVACDEMALDQMVTAVRRWALAHRWTPNMSVLLLEAPRYNPTLLAPGDAAIKPVAITREAVEQGSLE